MQVNDYSLSLLPYKSHHSDEMTKLLCTIRQEKHQTKAHKLEHHSSLLSISILKQTVTLQSKAFTKTKDMQHQTIN